MIGLGMTFEQKDAEEQRWLDSLPHCDYCGEPIQDEYLWDFGGEIVCDDCARSNFRRMNRSV